MPVRHRAGASAYGPPPPTPTAGGSRPVRRAGAPPRCERRPPAASPTGSPSARRQYPDLACSETARRYVPADPVLVQRSTKWWQPANFSTGMRVIHGIARPLQGMNNSMTEDEFSDLFRQTAGRLHAYAVRQVGQDAADDLVSETYAIAWRRRE